MATGSDGPIEPLQLIWIVVRPVGAPPAGGRRLKVSGLAGLCAMPGVAAVCALDPATDGKVGRAEEGSVGPQAHAARLRATRSGSGGFITSITTWQLQPPFHEAGGEFEKCLRHPAIRASRSGGTGGIRVPLG